MNKFIVAFRGLILGIKDKSILLQICIGIVVFLTAIILRLNINDLMVVVSLIFAVIIAEYFNTAIERLCDVYTLEKNDKIRDIKDLSSAAVLFMAILSAIIGLIIFSKYI